MSLGAFDRFRSGRDNDPYPGELMKRMLLKRESEIVRTLHTVEVGGPRRCLRVRLMSVGGEARVVLQALSNDTLHSAIGFTPQRLGALIAALNETRRFAEEKGFL